MDSYYDDLRRAEAKASGGRWVKMQDFGKLYVNQDRLEELLRLFPDAGKSGWCSKENNHTITLYRVSQHMEGEREAEIHLKDGEMIKIHPPKYWGVCVEYEFIPTKAFQKKQIAEMHGVAYHHRASKVLRFLHEHLHTRPLFSGEQPKNAWERWWRRNG